jgi:hypothetical protein
VIPSLGLLASLSYMMFFGSREWYGAYQSITIGIVVVVLLIIRAMLERRKANAG